MSKSQDVIQIPQSSSSLDVFEEIARQQSTASHAHIVNGANARTSQSTTTATVPAKSKTSQDGVIDLTLSDEEMPTRSLPAARPADDDDDIQIIKSNIVRPSALLPQQKPFEPEIQISKEPLLLGQLNLKVLIMHAIDDIKSSQPAPTPLIVNLRRSHVAMQDGTQKETIWCISTEGGETFGTMCVPGTKMLGPVMGGRPFAQGQVKFIAFLDRLPQNTPNPLMMGLHILVISVPAFTKAISDHLLRHTFYLNQPSIQYNGPERYSNPHSQYMAVADLERRRQAMISGLSGGNLTPGNMWRGGQRTALQAEEAKREQVEQIFAQMNSGADLDSVEPDDAVITPMYQHQKQALAFLIDRERILPLPPKDAAPDDSYVGLWRLQRSDAAYWINVVTGIGVPFSPLRPALPPQCRGAILADDMGLGKSLVIISLIINSLKDAIAFSKQKEALGRVEPSFDALKAHPVSTKTSIATSFQTVMPFGAPGMDAPKPKKKAKGKGKKELKREEAEARRQQRLLCRSAATLIVCPLSTVQNWEAQIKDHTKLGTLNVYVYHGPSRTSDPQVLASKDVVITTFSTLGTEYSKQSRAEDSSSEDADSDVEILEGSGQSTSESITKAGKKRKRKRPKPPPGTNCYSPLQQIEWFRIVLDEAHMIKEHSTIQARAACDLSAERRICLTGTPLQNSLNDLYSLVKFLQLEPFTDRAIWTHYIGGPAKTNDPLAVSRLQLLVRHIALRRSKDSKNAEGKPILTLPPKKDQLVWLDLNEQERAFYASHHKRYKAQFLENQQNDTLLQNYASILQELLRLRQICVHFALVRDSEDAAFAGQGGEDDPVELILKHGVSKSRAIAFYSFLRDSSSAQCQECGFELQSDDIETPIYDEEKKKSAKAVKSENVDLPIWVVTKCTHLYCFKCFRKHVSPTFPDNASAQDRVACDVCKIDITPVLDAVIITKQDVQSAALAADMINEGDVTRKTRSVEHSTKIRELMSDLMPFSQVNPASANYTPDFGQDPALFQLTEEESIDTPVQGTAIKSVVFSQWTKLLDRVSDALKEGNIRFGRLDGTMKREDRTKAMDSFRADPTCEVLLVSLRAGGVGLNLTMASRVYLMEPFWNPAVENQATDRIHRLGQTKPVKITRYVVKQSIEENMLEIQKRKMALASLSVSQTLSKAQLAQRRIEDLKILFK